MAQIKVLPPSETLAVVDAKEILKQTSGSLPEVDVKTGAPKTLKRYVVHEDPKITLVPGFLSPVECGHLLALAEGQFTRSLVGMKDGYTQPDGSPSRIEAREGKTRTSSSCMLRASQTAIVERIEHRLAALVGLPVEKLERLVVVRYSPNEHFNDHHDGKFRPTTVFLYLNDLPDGEGEGGDTFFPHLGLSVVPRLGTAVMWPNTLPDGKEDSRMVHAGRPPRSTIKWGVNAFFNVAPVRLVDNPTGQVDIKDAFCVELASLANSSSNGAAAASASASASSSSSSSSAAAAAAAAASQGEIRCFSFDTEPKIQGVPGFAPDTWLRHVVELAGNTMPQDGSFPKEIAAAVHTFGLAETQTLAELEVKLAAISRFPLEHLGPLRLVRCSPVLGLNNRCCSQRTGYLCISDQDEVFFPHLGFRCKLRRGDLLMWANAVRSETVDSDAYGGEGSSDTGLKRVVEDLRTTRVHIPPTASDEEKLCPSYGLELTFSDAPFRPKCIP